MGRRRRIGHGPTSLDEAGVVATATESGAQTRPAEKPEQGAAGETDVRSTVSAQCRLDLGTVLTIDVVDALKPVLIDLLSSHDPVGLDGGALEGVDTAGTQLLLSFFREAERCGLEVHWISTSEVLVRVATRLGLSQALGLGRHC